MTNTKRYIADAMSAMLNNDSDRAIGLLLRASLAYDDELSTKLPEAMPSPQFGEPDLPPIQPLNGKPKRIKPSSVSCPKCGAKKGDPCVKISERGRAGGDLGEPLAFGKTHVERRKKAKS